MGGYICCTCVCLRGVPYARLKSSKIAWPQMLFRASYYGELHELCCCYAWRGGQAAGQSDVRSPNSSLPSLLCPCGQLSGYMCQSRTIPYIHGYTCGNAARHTTNAEHLVNTGYQSNWKVSESKASVRCGTVNSSGVFLPESLECDRGPIWRMTAGSRNGYPGQPSPREIKKPLKAYLLPSNKSGKACIRRRAGNYCG